MNLKSQWTATRKDNSHLSLAERAELSCRAAKEFEKAGDYEAGREALAEFWPDRDGPLNLDGLEPLNKAEVLLRAGALAGWLRATDQQAGSQDFAKDLITQSIEAFESLDQTQRVAEARAELGLCYWREGSLDEARITLADALEHLGDDDDDDLKACILIRSGIVEASASHSNEAIRFYEKAAPFVERSNDPALKGSFHVGRATVFTRLSAAGPRKDYCDRALIEYAAASLNFEQAGNYRYVARVENNLGNLFFNIGEYKDAHDHLDRARHLFRQLKDFVAAASVDETRARTLLAQRYTVEAERIVRGAVRVLDRGGQQAILAEALATHGVALARLGYDTRARALFDRAIETAETAGDLQGAGRVWLNIIEELGNKITPRELVSIYRAAIRRLKDSQDPLSITRLMSGAERILDMLERFENEKVDDSKHSWEEFSLKKHVKAAESALIERALRESHGSVTRAAKLLGFNHHQSLISLLNTRHKGLMKARSKPRKRRQHLSAKPARAQKRIRKYFVPHPVSQLSILVVEDNDAVAGLVGEILEAENWRVERCLNGDMALMKLTGNDHYDVLIFDNNLPGISGLELVGRAKTITQRRRTPIIVLSGEDCEQAAWRAGADAFLLKAKAGEQLATTIRRILAQQKNEQSKSGE